MGLGQFGEGMQLDALCMWVAGALTNGCLTELLISHLAGNVGPHQHTHRDAEALPNHFGDELQPIGALVYPLSTG